MATVVVRREERASSPESVEDDLGALWREVADRGPVARAVLSNLVVFRRQERTASAPAAAAAVLDEVQARHPSRTIVLEHGDDDRKPESIVGASVGVCVFGPPATPYGVETIVIRSRCTETSLPSIVRGFARGDLPTSVWWTEDLSRVGPMPALVTMGRQLLFDSREWRDVTAGLRALAPILAGGRVDLADLNWRRLSPFREALVHVAPALGSRPSSGAMRITHATGDAALAWLLAGWLAAKLEWPAGEWPSIAASDGDERLTLIVDAGSAQLRIAMNDHRILVERPNLAPQVTAVPREDDAERVAFELRSLSRESPFHAALVALVARVVQS